MPQFMGDGVIFNFNANTSDWPTLSCTQPNRLALTNSDLEVEATRILLFQGDGHLSAQGALSFSTGSPTPSEKVRVLVDGKVGIGTPTPSQMLEVNGAIKATDFIKGATSLVSSQWSSVAGGINYTGGRVGIGVPSPSQALEVNGAIKAANFFKGADALVSSQWTDVAGGISYAGGNIGIGTGQPGAKLEINNGDLLFKAAAEDPGDIIFQNAAGVQKGRIWSHPAAGAGLYLSSADNTPDITIDADGKVGIGTTSPALTLDVRGYNMLTDPTAQYNSHFPFSDNNTYLTGKNIYLRGGAPQGWKLALAVDGTSSDVSIVGRLGTGGWSPVPRTVGWGGGIHTWDIEAEGTMWSRGGYQSGNRDLAENYASDMALEPGDVVCLDQAEDKVVLSGQPEDHCVVGVVSTAPGVLLNENHDADEGKMFPIALCGRVPCKVVAENGPIQRGDLLTSSSKPGRAMKAQPIVIDDQIFYRPGTILGKALSALTTGEGMIEIFVATS